MAITARRRLNESNAGESTAKLSNGLPLPRVFGGLPPAVTADEIRRRQAEFERSLPPLPSRSEPPVVAPRTGVPWSPTERAEIDRDFRKRWENFLKYQRKQKERKRQVKLMRPEFYSPGRTMACLKRAMRREIMFALGKAGRRGVGRGKPWRRVEASNYRC